MFGPLQCDGKQDTATRTFTKQAFTFLTTVPDIYSTASEGLNDHHVKLNQLLIYLTSKELSTMVFILNMKGPYFIKLLSLAELLKGFPYGKKK